MRGDIIMYAGKKWNPVDVAIMQATKGPWTHCEIDLGDGSYVGEHGKGITVHPQDFRIDSAIIRPVSKLGKAGIEAGMQWVEKVIAEAVKNKHTHEYGWLDIVDDAFKVLHRRVLLHRDGHWDCSHFCALYLQVAGADAELGGYDQYKYYTVSPNDLMRLFYRDVV